MPPRVLPSSSRTFLHPPLPHRWVSSSHRNFSLTERTTRIIRRIFFVTEWEPPTKGGSRRARRHGASKVSTRVPIFSLVGGGRQRGGGAPSFLVHLCVPRLVSSEVLTWGSPEAHLAVLPLPRLWHHLRDMPPFHSRRRYYQRSAARSFGPNYHSIGHGRCTSADCEREHAHWRGCLRVWRSGSLLFLHSLAPRALSRNSLREFVVASLFVNDFLERGKCCGIRISRCSWYFFSFLLKTTSRRSRCTSSASSIFWNRCNCKKERASWTRKWMSRRMR